MFPCFVQSSSLEGGRDLSCGHGLVSGLSSDYKNRTGKKVQPSSLYDHSILKVATGMRRDNLCA